MERERERARERARERERETETERQRERDRQTDSGREMQGRGWRESGCYRTYPKCSCQASETNQSVYVRPT